LHSTNLFCASPHYEGLRNRFDGIAQPQIRLPAALAQNCLLSSDETFSWLLLACLDCPRAPSNAPFSAS
jgi:hypothetical protein